METAEYIHIDTLSNSKVERFKLVKKGGTIRGKGISGESDYLPFNKINTPGNLTKMSDMAYDEIKEVVAMDENVTIRKKRMVLRLIPLILFTGLTFILFSFTVFSLFGIEIIHPLSAFFSSLIFGSLSYVFFRDVIDIGVGQ